ncbi:YrvL family regulatory protein [Bacillus litorisediminis]|uniref:YrvL family regulatory protein n=1 Tax=Bacillus litorisediminis TaxID=2922713 RepID=UPI001FAF6C95|nr:YrvL family regulatory protein [Bacillus litorisediminis]
MNKNKVNNLLKDLSLAGKIVAISSITLLIIFAISFPIGIYYFGFAGLLSLLDVPYTRISLLWFVLIFSFLSIFLDLVANALISVCTQNNLKKFPSWLVRMVIYSTFTWLSINAADNLIKSIMIPLKIELVAAFFDFILEDVTKDKKSKVKRLID